MKAPGGRTVFVSGVFNVVHPGHLRLLRFARELGDRLVVGVLSDDLSRGVATVKESARLDGVRSLRVVDEAVLVSDSVPAAIRGLRPMIVVKGREHANGPNPEAATLTEYGGRLVFSSGDSNFNSSDLIASEMAEARQDASRPTDFMQLHGVTVSRLRDLLAGMREKRVLVVGDVIVDEYISCHPLGMSREDPTLVVTPVDTRRFMGGAGVVAAHSAGLGASAHLVSVVGSDQQANFIRDSLASWDVTTVLMEDDSRPTTTKQRWRADDKTLLRVSHLRQDPIDPRLQDAVVSQAGSSLAGMDVVIFSDFNYGVLTDRVVAEVGVAAKTRDLVTAADSQSSSQIGDVSRFRGMDLLTPTEYEARLATRNFIDGLVIMADELREKAEARIVLMTLGKDGIFIRGAERSGDEPSTAQLPALNSRPVDVAGAGDALLVGAALARAAGASMHEAALVGSLSAAVQVSTVGNAPLTNLELLSALARWDVGQGY